MESYKRLGEKIKRLRKTRELTQEQLAELARVDPKTIIEIEGGKRANPTLKTLKKISRALNVRLEDFLSS